MDNFELIKQGAEAKLYKGSYLNKPAILKERFQKNYRHFDLDTKITHDRIKAEARIISRCWNIGIKTPNLYLVDLKRRFIIMEYFENSLTVKEFINENYAKSEVMLKLMQKIGQIIAKMHNNNIIHGDLTTSNMLLVRKDNNFGDGDENELAFIDFGLSYIEQSAEDKGVDLYVLERAFISTHHKQSDLFPVLLSAYEKTKPKESSAVMKKFEEVRARGRKRTMVG